MEIAGSKTSDEWWETKEKLEKQGSPELWKEAFEAFFLERLRTRYLEPIRKIQTGNKEVGEGFAIVAIQCSLIEFFQSIREGKNYKYKSKKEQNQTQNKFEYNKSSDMFKSFLVKQKPFNKVFIDGLEHEFYKNVRCSILHEARTSGGWLIWANFKYQDPCFEWVEEGKDRYRIQITAEPRIIDPSSKILYRNDMTAALWQYITAYGDELCTEKDLQEAFIRKFDALATP
jgi:hypothetical protein